MDNVRCNRIGKERSGLHRLLKVQLPTSGLRNEILSKSSALKALPDPWYKMYIKKDPAPCLPERE